MSEDNRPPTIFISYSHDSREHKQWVAKFAGALREKGVEVIFDQWDLEPGDDIPKFMERAVKAADRVLMVCTEAYVRKANDGLGGVGYEAMIVTSELVKDLGTRKFVPVVRQSVEASAVPDCVATRLYVDFSADPDFDEKIIELVRTLHNVVGLKPPLGPNPFADLRGASETTLLKQQSQQLEFGDALVDASKAYRIGVSLSNDGNVAQWRRFLRALEKKASSSLRSWRDEDSPLPTWSEKDPRPIFDHALKGVSFYMPLFACLVGGAESGKEEFAGQLGWIDEVIQPAGWELGGYVYWIEFPQLVLFVGQALIGGMLMEARMGRCAYNLATTSIGDLHRRFEAKPLYLQTRLNGWPESMAHTCTVAWGFLSKVLSSESWIDEVYGSVDKAKASVSSYYQMMSFLNFCKLSISGSLEVAEPSWPVSVPLNFCRWGELPVKSGYRTFLAQRELIAEVLAANDLADSSKFQIHWEKWMQICGKWLSNVFQWHFDIQVPQIHLPADLRNGGLSLA